MSRLSSIHRLAVGGAIAIAATFVSHRSATSAAPAPSAPFHLELVRAEPAVNAAVASPQQIKLWFSESIELKGTSIRVTNPRNEAVKLGKLSVDTAALAPATVVVPEKLAAGKYLVTWRAAGDDGHPSNGKYSFTVK